MSKIIIQKINVYTGSVGGTLIGAIHDVIVDSSQFSPTPNVVNVEDNQAINESYTIPFEFRTRATTFTGGSANTQNILGGANSTVSVDGTLPTKSYLEFVGASNSIDIESGAIYLNGYQDFSNGRRETMISGQLEVITASDGVTSAAGSGS